MKHLTEEEVATIHAVARQAAEAMGFGPDGEMGGVLIISVPEAADRPVSVLRAGIGGKLDGVTRVIGEALGSISEGRSDYDRREWGEVASA